MQLKAEDYIAIRLASVAFQVADQRVTELMRAQGLDPTKPHAFNDAELTITPVGEPGPEKVTARKK